MKKIVISALLLFGVANLSAQHIVEGNVAILALEMAHEGETFIVEMTMDFCQTVVHNNRGVVYTPVLYGNGQVKELPSVAIFGRRRLLLTERSGWMPQDVDEELMFDVRKRPESLDYRAEVRYEEWMNGSQLRLERRTYGCCNTLLKMGEELLGDYEEWVYQPVYLFVQPVAEQEKVRTISGTAFIDFPISKRVIQPNFGSNRIELNKITATIDSIRGDQDITLKLLSIKGFASPDGPYAFNNQLAKSRTEALKNYVERLYDFSPGLIHTSYEAENWSGVCAWLDSVDIPNRAAMLQIIENTADPDHRDARLKAAYPIEYRRLLKECYPALRRTNYSIEYQIRSFTQPEEIITLVETAPQKLSLEEFYLASQALEEGSPAYGRLFEQAVKAYPDDPTANLNAANSAMQRGDLRRAAHYLTKAGNSAEAEYARGVHAMQRGDYVAAEHHFRQAEGHVEAARMVLDQLQRYK